jgi:purine nucleosidase
LLQPVKDFAEVWFNGRDHITFHDPLAATTIFNDAICTFERGTVDVELQSERSMGMTYWTADAAGACEVAVDVDADTFFEEYFSVF